MSCAIPDSTACIPSIFCEEAWYQACGAWATAKPTVSLLMLGLKNGLACSSLPSMKKKSSTLFTSFTPSPAAAVL